jgi:hypothetical protein
MPTPPPQVRPIITETTEAAAVLDRLMMACVTGKNAETVLGPGGLGALTEHKLWTEAAEGIARLDAVHRDAQRAFLNTWMRVGYVLRGYVADDDAFFAMLARLRRSRANAVPWSTQGRGSATIMDPKRAHRVQGRALRHRRR